MHMERTLKNGYEEGKREMERDMKYRLRVEMLA